MSKREVSYTTPNMDLKKEKKKKADAHTENFKQVKNKINIPLYHA